MTAIGAQIEDARSVGGELGIAGGVIDRFLHHLDRFGDLAVGGAADDEMVGFGGVAVAIAGTDSGPESGVIEMPDGDARVAGGGGVRTVTSGDGVVRGHLARGRKLDGARQVAARGLEQVGEGAEHGGQADFGMTVAGGDGRLIALRTWEERAVDFLDEGFDIGAVVGTERVQVDGRAVRVVRDGAGESEGAG